MRAANGAHRRVSGVAPISPSRKLDCTRVNRVLPASQRAEVCRTSVLLALSESAEVDFTDARKCKSSIAGGVRHLSCDSTRSSSLREVVIVLFTGDCSQHIPSRGTTHAIRERLCLSGDTQYDHYNRRAPDITKKRIERGDSDVATTERYAVEVEKPTRRNKWRPRKGNTINRWLSRIERDERKERDAAVQDLQLRCYTKQEVAASVGVPRPSQRQSRKPSGVCVSKDAIPRPPACFGRSFVLFGGCICRER